MTLPSDTTLALIRWLASRDTAQLHTLIRHRDIPLQACESFRSLAQALLDPDTIQATLQTLPRAELLALNTLEAADTARLTALSERGLVSLDGDAPDLLIPRSSLDLLADIDTATGEPPAPTPGELSERDLAAASSVALTLVIAVSDCLDVLSHTPLGVNAEGSLTAVSLKTLQTLLGSGYEVSGAVDLARLSGLIGSNRQLAALTPSGWSWMNLPDHERYAHLVQSWWKAVPTWLRQVIIEHPGSPWDSQFSNLASYHYPLAPTQPVLSESRTQALSLGLLSNAGPTPWMHALATSGDVAQKYERWMPAAAPGVFAHDDFTLLATGPLSPTHRDILSRLASLELGGLVPRYRLTASSVLTALQDGLSANEMHAMLAEVCVNDSPASMRALIDDVSRRALEIEVHPRGDHTRIFTTREGLSEELLSDPSLIVLGLSRAGQDELSCSWPAERVHSTLIAASYSNLLMSVDGGPQVPSLLVAEKGHHDDTDDRDALLTALVEGARDLAAKGIPAGLTSIIEVATETKTPLEIEVRMPDESLVTVVMEPRALSAGRLRGVELKHAVEKTLPVSHITSIRAWEGQEA